MTKRSNIIGFAFLVVLLTAGAAQGLSGTNTVDSGDIVDFTIVANDIKTAAIGGRPIVDNSLKTADIDESSLKFPCSSSAGPSFASVDGDVSVPDTYSSNSIIEARNCSGGDVQVKRIGAGAYCVKFLTSSQVNAVISPLGGAFQAGVVDRAGTVCDDPSPAQPGTFQVSLRSNDTTAADIDFTILAF